MQKSGLINKQTNRKCQFCPPGWKVALKAFRLHWVQDLGIPSYKYLLPLLQSFALNYVSLIQLFCGRCSVWKFAVASILGNVNVVDPCCGSGLRSTTMYSATTLTICLHFAALPDTKIKRRLEIKSICGFFRHTNFLNSLITTKNNIGTLIQKRTVKTLFSFPSSVLLS